MGLSLDPSAAPALSLWPVAKAVVTNSHRDTRDKQPPGDGARCWGGSKRTECMCSPQVPDPGLRPALRLVTHRP
jgi:hypothetical protein